MTGRPDEPSPSAVGRRSFVVSARSTAPVEEVWPLVGEARRWQEWTFLDRSELERPGSPDPDGVGAIRRFTRHGIGSREEVVAWDPPIHLEYTIRSGFPVRNYRADVDLRPAGTGTSITWSVRFDERIPGTGWLMYAILHRLVTGFVMGLADHTSQHRV